MRKKFSPPSKGRGVGRNIIVNAVALLVAIPTLSYSLYIDSPYTLSESALRLMADAAVGMSASIEPNPYNTLAQQLSNKEALLNERETQITSQERAGIERASSLGIFGFVSFCISIFLLILVGINFYFDIRRRQKGGWLARKFLVDLR